MLKPAHRDTHLWKKVDAEQYSHYQQNSSTQHPVLPVNIVVEEDHYWSQQNTCHYNGVDREQDDSVVDQFSNLYTSVLKDKEEAEDHLTSLVAYQNGQPY